MKVNFKILFIDCDGTLTDGNYFVSSDGSVTKVFNTADFHAIHRLRSLGIRVIILTGANDGAADVKAASVNLECVSDVKNKVEAIEEIIGDEYTWDEVGFIGDAENDLAAIKKAGFSACPWNAIREVQDEADFVIPAQGGQCAIRAFAKQVVAEMGHDWLTENETGER